LGLVNSHCNFGYGMTTPFDFIKAIGSGQNLLKGTENDELMEKDYNAFLINRGFSMFQDTVLYAQAMNERSNLPAVCQNDFYLGTIRPKKRFGWHKKDSSNSKYLEAVKSYFKVGPRKAEEYCSVLSPEALAEILESLEHGTTKNENNKKQDAGNS
jgi:hypothetical protein